MRWKRYPVVSGDLRRHKEKTGHSRSQEQWMEVWVLGANPRVGGEGTDMPVWNRGVPKPSRR